MAHIRIFLHLLLVGSLKAGLPYKQLFPYSNDNRNWADEAQADLKMRLEQKWNLGKAKNVIMFLGDGMGLPTVTASRIYKGQMKGEAGEDGFLSFDKFPNVALSRTYNADSQITDSASAATAYLCGQKVNFGTVGVSHNVPRGDCSKIVGNDDGVSSILDWSLAEGKSVGLISTARMTHASPGGAYAHSADRNWESDDGMPDDIRDGAKCKDIARQLIEDNPKINVLMGGGRRHFHPDGTPDIEYPSDTTANGRRLDNKNLTQEWIAKKKKDGAKHAYVWNKAMFDAVKPEDTDFLFGLFEPNHMKYTLDRSNSDVHKEPTVAEMTEKAIQILSKNEKGFFLFVEGARIDHGHHDGKAHHALADAVAFDEAVQKGVDMTSEKDTLIVVTADHSHTMHMTGYTGRGTNILGIVDPVATKRQLADDGLPYLTLGYADGPGPIERTDLSDVDTTGKEYRQPSKVAMSEATHGGEEVAIYARGPMSHLFNGVVEEHYIPHAMAYASCVGRNKGHCNDKTPLPETCRGSNITTTSLSVIMLTIFVINTLSF